MKTNTTSKLTATILAGITLMGVLSLASCDTGKNDDDSTMTTLGILALSSKPVTINFGATTDGASWDCSSSSLKLNGDSITPTDLRFYVSGISLIGSDGTTLYPVTLDNDAKWQTSSVALLDMQTSSCDSADEANETRTVVQGTIPALAPDTFSGIQFSLGVPEASNHQYVSDSATPSPMNIQSMNWNWTIGYKFLKFEYTDTSSRKWHLGSLSCEGTINYAEDGTTAISYDYECSKDYYPTVSLTSTSGYTPSSNTVTLQLDKLISGFQKTEPSCMPIGNGPSGTPKTDCEPWLRNLGLDPSAGTISGTQTAFTLQ